MPNDPSLSDLRQLPTSALFRHVFAEKPHRERREQRERENREREVVEELNRRRAYLASLREPHG